MSFKTKEKKKCPFCKKEIYLEYEDETKENPFNFVKYKNRYYHLQCYEERIKQDEEKERKKKQKEKENEDRKKIFDYMNANTTRQINYPVVNQQLKKLLKNGRTYSGILGTLKFLEETNTNFDPYSLAWVDENYEAAKSFFNNRKKIRQQIIKKSKTTRECVVVKKQEKKKKQKWSLD